eukprot:26084-Eustigmatos_ZCMA.PRE.1
MSLWAGLALRVEGGCTRSIANSINSDSSLWHGLRRLYHHENLLWEGTLGPHEHDLAIIAGSKPCLRRDRKHANTQSSCTRPERGGVEKRSPRNDVTSRAWCGIITDLPPS